MNPFSLFLLVIGVGLVVGAGFISTSWTPLAFIGLTVIVLSVITEIVTGRRTE